MKRTEQGPADGLWRNVKLVFIVGCGRSGTTWVQLLLAQHPAVATWQETHLFEYLAALDRLWKHELSRGRKVGLRQILSADEFYTLCRDIAERVLRKIWLSNPRANVILEKHQVLHSDLPDLPLKLFPDAYFLHVIRDPRSVVCSLRNASNTWGRDWAPSNLIEATTTWCRFVEVRQRIRMATQRYNEVRYEALCDDGPAELAQLLTWLGLPFDHSFPEKAVRTCDIGNLQAASPDVAAPWPLEDEPVGFFRRGTKDGWRQELSPNEVRTVEYIARDLMDELGYRRTWEGPLRRPLRLLARQSIEGLEWRSQRFFKCFFQWLLERT